VSFFALHNGRAACTKAEVGSCSSLQVRGKRRTKLNRCSPSFATKPYRLGSECARHWASDAVSFNARAVEYPIDLPAVPQ